MDPHLSHLSSSGLLDLAIGLETSNARRYREWADRFRPFDTGVSILFEDMAVRCDRHGSDLRAWLSPYPIGRADPNAAHVESYTENALNVGEHFFVVDRSMARRILTSAISTLSKARGFYKSVLVTTRNISIRQACRPRTLPSIGHIGRLHRFLEQY